MAKIYVSVSGMQWRRVGDLVKTLEPEISKIMADAIKRQMTEMGNAPFSERAEQQPPRDQSTIYFEDLTTEPWENRARAAGMTDDEIETAKARMRGGGGSLVVNGTAREVSDE